MTEENSTTATEKPSVSPAKAAPKKKAAKKTVAKKKATKKKTTQKKVTPTKEGSFRITVKKDGFRRAGRSWSGVTDVAADELNKEQVEQLQSDPMFEVEKL